MMDFHIGNDLLSIDTLQTKEFYSMLPKITQNCSCGDCAYFEQAVITQDLPLFHLLTEMGVDLTRQSNITPDDICCLGETENGRIGYLGYYKVVGHLKNQNKVIEGMKDDFGPFTTLVVKEEKDQELIFDFYIEVEKTLEEPG
jgi:hypothetical protein